MTQRGFQENLTQPPPFETAECSQHFTTNQWDGGNPGQKGIPQFSTPPAVGLKERGQVTGQRLVIANLSATSTGKPPAGQCEIVLGTGQSLRKEPGILQSKVGTLSQVGAGGMRGVPKQDDLLIKAPFYPYVPVAGKGEFLKTGFVLQQSSGSRAGLNNLLLPRFEIIRLQLLEGIRLEPPEKTAFVSTDREQPQQLLGPVNNL